MSACPGIAYGDAFVAGAVNAADCQARAIASLGYQALATPGSDAALVLTGLLTLFVALFGYRLTMGETPGVRDGVTALAKIGLVLALATSWVTYRTLAYDVVLKAPAELAATVGGAAGLPGTAGDMTARLQLVDRGLAKLGELGVGKHATGSQIMRVQNINGHTETVVENAQQPTDVVGPVALALARALFLTSSVGGIVVVRLIAAILLALGPIFATFLLFDTTRGWFAGWLRGLVATMVGAFGITILAGVVLTLVEPWVAGLVERRVDDQSIAGAPVELMVMMLVFALAILAMLAAAARVAGGFRFPDSWRAATGRWTNEIERQLQISRMVPVAASEPPSDRPRAAVVADAIVATQRREAAVTTDIAIARRAAVAPLRAPAAQALARDLPATGAPPLGQSLGSRRRNRVSASAGRRDTRA